MPVKRRQPKNRLGIPPAVDAYFFDQPIPPEEIAQCRLIKWILDYDFESAIFGKPSDLWSQNEAEIIAEWAEAHPGTRPRCWWRWSSPRVKPGDLAGRAADFAWGDRSSPRQRLGGIGTPQYEVLNMVPSFRWGVPNCWISHDDVERYNGRDKAGQQMGYAEGEFLGVPPDPDNPPIFESQAAYLRRHGLLVPGELERLQPSDFEPESVFEILGWRGAPE